MSVSALTVEPVISFALLVGRRSGNEQSHKAAGSADWSREELTSGHRPSLTESAPTWT